MSAAAAILDGMTENAMSERGWTASREQLLQIQLLDWTYDSTRGSLIPDVGEWIDSRQDGVDEATAKGLIAGLETQGLVDVAATMGGIRSWGVRLTSRGEAVVRARHDRRTNASARATATREALLDWFYEQKRRGQDFPNVDDVRDDASGHFEGSPFTEKELDDAAGHLQDRGLIQGNGAWGRALIRGTITTAGEDVVENHDGSLAAWAISQRSGQQFVTHFNAPVHGQVGIGEQVTQTQHNPRGIDAPTLLRLIEDVREAAMSVEQTDQAYLLTYLDVIQAEATSTEPNREILRGSGDRLKAIAGKAADAGLSASVGALVGFIAKMLGIS